MQFAGQPGLRISLPVPDITTALVVADINRPDGEVVLSAMEVDDEPGRENVRQGGAQLQRGRFIG